MAKRAHTDPKEPVVPQTMLQSLFSTRRQILIFSFYIFFLCVNISLLGLVSHQIHKHGNVWTAYPDGRFYHALGLGLFVGIFLTLVGISHAYLNHMVLMFAHFAAGVMSGTVAGLFTMTPFGHGLQCGNPIEKFAPKYRPFVSECAEYTAITGLAWAMFGLNVIALFWLAQDAFSCVRRNHHIYAPWEPPAKVSDVESDAEHH
ncbi:hypothetical protein CC85DRAFT_283928 [Cutaneotrichosporon oleaginosum]|uniref:MARVEL domain-containing protein n=1 Tax=Cutaneotrichosporon oleaginosum TaxID=879819 RepID=A0A0J1B8N8_9TREE|nr:uncharacterized protein CC85DRAFT_283928 [Cutaneotrichosporon oleaginosum]KLT44139.1 hypothetical protein CC85DRAFT_283928 [Cutaneotrichosporon oleaginosum]TXT09406.1 hypothetical protein COLE_03340 [Cutaneotrichosporon oleaginosum]